MNQKITKFLFTSNDLEQDTNEVTRFSLKCKMQLLQYICFKKNMYISLQFSISVHYNILFKKSQTVFRIINWMYKQLTIFLTQNSFYLKHLQFIETYKFSANFNGFVSVRQKTRDICMSVSCHENKSALLKYETYLNYLQNAFNERDYFCIQKLLFDHCIV